MRLFSVPPPTLLAGFLAVLIGYASSAAIIWQAAIVAGATTAQISGWMTALGLAMGVSTLALTLWYRVPVLTAWSTPGAALLVTGLQGLTLNEAIGEQPLVLFTLQCGSAGSPPMPHNRRVSGGIRPAEHSSRSDRRFRLPELPTG